MLGQGKCKRRESGGQTKRSEHPHIVTSPFGGEIKEFDFSVACLGTQEFRETAMSPDNGASALFPCVVSGESCLIDPGSGSSNGALPCSPCPADKFFYFGECIDACPHLSRRVGRMCQCEHGTVGKTCVARCPDETFLDLPKWRLCSPCSQCSLSEFQTNECGSDAEPTQDTACQTCTACNQSQYVTVPCKGKQDTQCASCDAQCNGCRGPGPRQCRACQNVAYLAPDAKEPICLTECPTGTFNNHGRCDKCTVCGVGKFEVQACTKTQDRVCNPCDAQCASSCSGMGPDKCHSCLNNKHGKNCVATCPIGFVQVGDSKICEPCNEQCGVGPCFGTGPDECYGCKHVLDGSVCKVECPKNKWADSARTCRPCSDKCLLSPSRGCSGPEPSQCDECEFATFNNTCVSRCPHTYYSVAKTCVKCRDCPQGSFQAPDFDHDGTRSMTSCNGFYVDTHCPVCSVCSAKSDRKIGGCQRPTKFDDVQCNECKPCKSGTQWHGHEGCDGAPAGFLGNSTNEWVCKTCTPPAKGQFRSGGCDGVDNAVLSDCAACPDTTYAVGGCGWSASTPVTKDTQCAACKLCAPGDTYQLAGSCNGHPLRGNDTTCLDCTRCGSRGGTDTWTSSSCTVVADTVCTNCGACDAETEYIATPCDEWQDTKCAKCTHPSTGEYIAVPCNKTSNTVVAKCTVPGAGEYEVQPCSDVADTVVAKCTVPASKQEFIVTPCNSSSNTVVAACANCTANETDAGGCDGGTANRVCRLKPTSTPTSAPTPRPPSAAPTAIQVTAATTTPSPPSPVPTTSATIRWCASGDSPSASDCVVKVKAVSRGWGDFDKIKYDPDFFNDVESCAKLQEADGTEMTSSWNTNPISVSGGVVGGNFKYYVAYQTYAGGSPAMAERTVYRCVGSSGVYVKFAVVVAV